MKLLKTYAFMLWLCLPVLLIGCGVYSFTGASIPAEAESVTIRYFDNNAPQVNPSLSQELTDALKDKFQSQTSLQIQETGGDLYFEGEIVEYGTRPVAIQGDDQAAMNRLTVKINVKFVNRIEEELSFEKSFSRHEDFDSNQSLSTMEDQLIEQIVEYLVNDIFNESVVNW
ncbi:MAG: LptE family protein [Bacteroidales bacterium]